ncbi:sodium:solute symporter [Leptospira perolatii]|uniref:Sodium:solute symporter n=1 Tax=Leptospira perolatii TaxID=2023191 RepID=A0A2M9ZJJ8_9LEPT|nr:sodium:solute symporter [Leptospira perolatii]PJZ68582.1 sodium:solute symporter [Leptospira perolatii]PJZ72237.1 sodium:solute symporter [Leptospira perolatii]
MQFGWGDALILFFYFSLVLYSGWKSGKSDSDSSEFFLAGKTLSWIPLSLSIVATETSALTFLTVPGMSFSGNFTFLQVVFGYIVGRTIVSFFLLPLVYHHNFLSVYEWVGAKFGKSSQKVMSGLFSFTRLLGDGVRLFASTLPVAFLLQVALGKMLTSPPSEYWIGVGTLVFVMAITAVYTMQGGFRSVVWVDTVQYFIYIFGGLVALFILLGQTDQLSSKLSEAITSGKLNVLDWNFSHPYFFFWAVIGGALLSLGTHGADQMFVQRALAAKRLKDAQKAMIGSGIAVFVQMILFLAIGTLLYFRYAGQDIHQDKVFSKFIVEEVPTPILGLILSGILASTMSTLSSSINSLALTASVDFGWNFWNRKVSTLFFALLLFLSSFFFFSLPEAYTKGLLELGLKISSFTVGSMVAVFLFEVVPFLRKRIQTNDTGLSISLASSILLTASIGLKSGWGFTILVPIGMILLWGFAFLTGFLFPRKSVH